MEAWVNLTASLAWLAVPLTVYFAIIRPVMRARITRDQVDWESVKECDRSNCSLKNHLL